MNYLKTYFFNIVFKNYFNAAGRATRKEFWFFTLNLIIICFLLISVLAVSFLLMFSNIKRLVADPSSVSSLSMIQMKTTYILTFVTLAFPFLLAFPYLNLVVRRLHDINLSSWWLLLYLIPQIGALVILIFMCLPGTKGANKYDVEPGTKKFGFASLIIILITLAMMVLFMYVGKYMHDKIEGKGEQIVDKIAQAELKYYEQNNDFLYVDKTDSNDILDINLQNNLFYNEFSCTAVTGMKNAFTLDDKSSKQVEIRVWERPDKKDKEQNKEKYMYVIMNDKGAKTKIDKKIHYKKLEEKIKKSLNINDKKAEE